MNTLAIDIGGTKYTVALFKGNRMVFRHTALTNAAGGRRWMLGKLLEISKQLKNKYNIDRCGIGFGGPVDFDKQRTNFSTHVGGWENFKLTEFIEKHLKVPAITDNDANTGALGEALFGAGKGCSHLLYMTLSTGIGGGIVIDGKIYRGADSSAGEIGHMTVNPEGPRCLCGSNGCFERLCGGLWLNRDYGKPAKELIENTAFLKKYVKNLALGLKNCIMLVNPERIVIGGGISKAGSSLFRPLNIELKKQLSGWKHLGVDVVRAGLGDDSVIYGALALAKELK